MFVAQYVWVRGVALLIGLNKVTANKERTFGYMYMTWDYGNETHLKTSFQYSLTKFT